MNGSPMTCRRGRVFLRKFPAYPGNFEDDITLKILKGPLCDKNLQDLPLEI